MYPTHFPFRFVLKLVFGTSVLGAGVVTLLALAGFIEPLTTLGWRFSEVNNSPKITVPTHTLEQLALQKVLSDASPILGKDQSVQRGAREWMKAYPDDTKIVNMNIPGTHDTATWNYSIETQRSLKHITHLVDDAEFDPAFLRCQQRSIVSMLNAGIRVFDLRYAYDITNSTLVFWHGPGLQSETATVDGVLFGFYQWLETYPSEAVFLSFQYEGNAEMQNVVDAGVQLALYNVLTSPAAKRYVLQTRGSFGTLGDARGKITLLKRFDLNLLPASFGEGVPGVHFSPTKWTPNGRNTSLVYNETTGATAHIQDYFRPLTPKSSSAEENIKAKYDATTAHLEFAAQSYPDSLFWGFASSTNTDNVPPDTPRIQALGNGTLTPAGGVNHQLVPFLKRMKGKRLGILLFDFFEDPEELVPLYLSLLPPEGTRSHET